MNDDIFASKERDSALLALLGALVGCHGRVGAAEVLGVNYRTLKKALESREMTSYLRQVLEEFGSSSPANGTPSAVGSEVGVGEGEGQETSLLQRVNELEVENMELKMVVEAQTAHLQELWRRVTSVEEGQGSGVLRRPGRKNRRNKDGGGVGSGVTYPLQDRVVTIVPRFNENSLLGVAAPRVSRWREVRNRATALNDPVDRAEAKVDMLEIELDLIQHFHLTLPPHLEPWDPDTRSDEIFKRKSVDLPEAREELNRAKKDKERDRK